MAFINHPVPDVVQYYPLNDPAIGTPRVQVNCHQGEDIPLLFQPITIGDVTFKNRIFVSPMCQYSSDNGHATDWHFVHIGGFATRGVGAIIMEATSVVPEGRISPEDAGLWTDSQIAPLKRIVNFAHAQGTKIGVQLAHAGRKASTYAPWVQERLGAGGRNAARKEENGWPDNVVGPTTTAWSENFPNPRELSAKELDELDEAFVAAIKRCEEVGFDFIEIHGAHGYLISSFVSPLSNTRTDEFGGQPLENRIRWPLRLISRCRSAWKKPLFVRISASDWAEGSEKNDDGTWAQWGIEQSTIFAGEMKKIGVDLIDVSSAGNWFKQKIIVKPGYQVPFAEAIKKAHPSLAVGAVGFITEGKQAESYLQEGKADVVLLARALIKDPHWVLSAARDLGINGKIKAANQYERAFYHG
ncbi:nadh:flavin oxidoreductase nadh oxidase [Moniliophthora roreri MCA 2997]|uniref:Nadh:flavin oxidoreductase nadh oxidase n=1 Tax=Moniliophthora roreri (strain MCA 2997) TaxID=1381753 RepID=V2XG99_MONRO|nr:nadh:flavin oxidoreductase nadh oxidase [Moniliophthora roreri MCA 2997]